MKNLSFLIKPVSGACNLRCRYCFYADETSHRKEKNLGRMSRKTAMLLIDEAFANCELGGTVSFAFQGGEPTLAGLDFYSFFVEQAKANCPCNVHLAFSMQTNGIFINEKWADFFKRHGFLVGISLDGTKSIHDNHRVDPDGNGSWNKVLHSVQLLQRKDVNINALCVVTKSCSRHARAVYQSLKNVGFHYLQFIACLDPLNSARGSMPWSLPSEEYGKFLCTLFDLWYADWEKKDYHSVRLFDDYIHLMLNDGASTCSTCGNCGSYIVVEADGTVYPCDFYCLDEWNLGRLGEDKLSEIFQSSKLRDFYAIGQKKPLECTTCTYRLICNGGCKNDWILGSKETHNYYCSAFCQLFEYAMPRMQRVAYAEINFRRSFLRNSVILQKYK